MARLKTELLCRQWKDWKVILCAAIPPADAKLNEKNETELTEKNWKPNFCAGNPPADAELTGKAETELTEKIT
jgi:hypothetical protein